MGPENLFGDVTEWSELDPVRGARDVAQVGDGGGGVTPSRAVRRQSIDARAQFGVVEASGQWVEYEGRVLSIVVEIGELAVECFPVVVTGRRAAESRERTRLIDRDIACRGDRARAKADGGTMSFTDTP